jgi:hypothetical protein
MGFAAPLGAQATRQLAADTRLHKEPAGAALASLAEGADVRTGRTRGSWVEVGLEGWIYSASVSPTKRDGFDLSVSSEAGENLRESANGEVLARLSFGTLLERLEAKGGWTRVRRSGWVPRASVRPGKDAAPAPRQTAQQPTIPKPPAQKSPVQQPVGPAAPPPASPSTRADASGRIEVARPAQLFTAPEGGEVGTLQPGASGRVLGRSGEWVRVQLEGWVREGDLKSASGGALVGVTAAEVRADPARYVGEMVEWRVQFIAMQVADALRPEIPAGQPYLLTRGPLPEPGFVYVIVAPDQLARFRALAPLAEVTIRATVRAAQTRYLQTPVVELISSDAPPAPAGR